MKLTELGFANRSNCKTRLFAVCALAEASPGTNRAPTPTPAHHEPVAVTNLHSEALEMQGSLVNVQGSRDLY